ncbi:MAG TPA: hypothetical protein VF936_07795 [Burkholderiales bacterium]
MQAISGCRGLQWTPLEASLEDPNRKPSGTPYKEMKPRQKMLFILKVAICILTFGMAFPNVMSD